MPVNPTFASRTYALGRNQKRVLRHLLAHPVTGMTKVDAQPLIDYPRNAAAVLDSLVKRGYARMVNEVYFAVRKDS